MLRTALLILVCVLSTTLVYAATVTYQAGPKMGPVSFDHQAHQQRYVKAEGCSACHSGTPAKIDAFGKGKAAAHAVCYDCHKQQKISQCTICHK